ncbi:MAG: ABC transporter permease, partial [Nitrospinota bacterium]
MLSDLHQRQLRAFWRNRVAVIGAVMSLLLILVALLAETLSPYDPVEQNVFYRLTPPELSHPFGTDSYGRDILSRIIWGSRISLAVGIGSVALGMVLGSFLGMIAAFKGEKMGGGIMRAVDILLCFPAEILAIMVLVVLGQGLDKLIITIGIVMTLRFARLSYGSTLSLKEREYIEAARSIGARGFRILFRYILPNILGEILVMSSLWT